eukprot:TRINITY_DN74236_c0_g1_i1.p1 TRINITY_DN74236_c0_g1~~TRINITY_DN74236_c0_g1_i1.p1  ORF type:complete len:305 (-),score=28.48 TRINITY_DN74236_c0_g1_i1:330-1244(-)
MTSAAIRPRGLSLGHLSGDPNTWAAELPTFEEVVEEFGLFGGQCEPSTSQGGILTCECKECTRWRAFFSGGPFYEVHTHGHVAELARYLVSLAHERQSLLRGGPLRILEVGAGSGLLTAHLRSSIRTLVQAGTVEVLQATDRGDRGLAVSSLSHIQSEMPSAAALPVVECMSYTDALVVKSPHVVICSWMPLGQDWTPAFRRCPSVFEYILIGEADTGVCGSRATWFRGKGPARRRARARGWDIYESVGWRRRDLEAVTGVGQVCRLDDRWDSRRHSSTVSFRREAILVPLWPSKRRRLLPISV